VRRGSDPGSFGAGRVAQKAYGRAGSVTRTNLNDFMATRDGLTLAKAFMTIGDIRLRRQIVDLVEKVVGPRKSAQRNLRDLFDRVSAESWVSQTCSIQPG
jgi:hypothetical protein